MLYDSLANAVMIGLDRTFSLLRRGDAEQVALLQERECLPPISIKTCRLDRDDLADRLSGHGHDLEQSPRWSRKSFDPAPENRIELQLRSAVETRTRISPAQMLHELVHEVGISARLARNCVGRTCRCPRLLPDQRHRQLTRFLRVQRGNL